MGQRSVSRQFQPQGIAGRVAVVRFLQDQAGGLLQQVCTEQADGTEVKIVAHAARLAVDDGVGLQSLFGLPVVVGKDHAASRSGEVVRHPLQCHIAQFEGLGQTI